jgi:guanylate cyclase
MKLVRVLDVGADPADEPDLRIRKRTAVALALVAIAVGTLIGLVDLAAGRPVQVVLATIQVVVFAGALALFARNHRLTPLIATMVVVGLAVLLVSLVPAGGLSYGSANVIWIILVPIAAVLFLGPRAGLPALAGVIIVVVVGIIIDPSVRTTVPEAETGRLLLIALNVVIPAAVALGLVVFIDGERVRAKAESDALLLNILPRSIADRLKRGERVIADHYDEVTILFADVVDFTPFAAHETPARVVEVLDDLFSAFDTLAERHGLEKIKTIGDAYMVVAGAPEPRADHASVIVDMALEMLDVATSVEPTPGNPFRLRIGIASGPAVAGVIGHRKFSYDVWGDAVNLASRMESTGVPGAIQVAASTWGLCADRYRFAPREVDIKGLGEMRTYLLDPRSMDSSEAPTAAGERSAAQDGPRDRMLGEDQGPDRASLPAEERE